jgi:hypothetical protein
MNYTEIIKRAARITWRYKVLWILGILLALSSSNGPSNSITYTLNDSNGAMDGMGQPMFPGWNLPDPGVIAGFVLLCCCLLAVLVVVLTIVQYVARTGLYRAVDQIEETSAALTWREGIRLGWSNRALRMFLLDLLVGIAVFVGVIVLLLLAASPLLLLIFDVEALSIFGGILTAGLMFLAILLIIALIVVVSVLQQFWRRQIALDDRTVGEALSLGTLMARGKAGDVAIFWVLMTIVGVLFGIVLIPLVIGLGLLALTIGGGLGYTIYSLFDSAGWAVLLGLPLFILILSLPLLLIQGVYLVFESSAWTLAYREVRSSAAPTAVEPAPSPV